MTDLVQRLRDVDEEFGFTLCAVAADRIEQLEAEVLEQARLLGIGGEKELALTAKLEAVASQLAIYEKHGVTCQTFGHKLTGCAECNRDDFSAMKEQK